MEWCRPVVMPREAPGRLAGVDIVVQDVVPHMAGGCVHQEAKRRKARSPQGIKLRSARAVSRQPLPRQAARAGPGMGGRGAEWGTLPDGSCATVSDKMKQVRLVMHFVKMGCAANARLYACQAACGYVLRPSISGFPLSGLRFGPRTAVRAHGCCCRTARVVCSTPWGRAWR